MRSSDRRPLVKVFREVVDTLTKPPVDLGVATEKLLRVLDRRIHSTENFRMARDAMHAIASLDLPSARRLFRSPTPPPSPGPCGSYGTSKGGRGTWACR